MTESYRAWDAALLKDARTPNIRWAMPFRFAGKASGEHAMGAISEFILRAPAELHKLGCMHPAIAVSNRLAKTHPEVKHSDARLVMATPGGDGDLFGFMSEEWCLVFDDGDAIARHARDIANCFTMWADVASKGLLEYRDAAGARKEDICERLEMLLRGELEDLDEIELSPMRTLCPGPGVEPENVAKLIRP